MTHGSGIPLRVMRRAALPLAVLLALSAPAGAQVTVDLHALEALPAKAGRPAPPPRPRHAVRAPPHRTARARGTEKTAVASAKPAAPAPTGPANAAPANPAPTGAPVAVAASLPSLPAAPPPVPPPTVVATLGSPAPPAPSKDRTLRVGFAAGQSDLPASDADALTALAHDTPRGDTTSFEVAAYAPAIGGDASTARRLSLARALAVRGALVGAGVPAASIYVRALGAPHPGQPGGADRAVVTVMGANGVQQKQASQR
ncbi:MAG TPA: OmpA family protein [Acetobacteraceae bacterium]